MVLVDTSAWVAHLRGDPNSVAVSTWLQQAQVLSHPFVLGELALGGLRQRAHINTLMAALPQAQVATDAEVMHLITHATLSGKGIGYIDAHLLAATLLTPSARLFTLDMRLRSVAQTLGVAEVARVY